MIRKQQEPAMEPPSGQLCTHISVTQQLPFAICPEQVALMVRIQARSCSLPPPLTVCWFLITPDWFKRKGKDVRQHMKSRQILCFPLPHLILALFPRSESWELTGFTLHKSTHRAMSSVFLSLQFCAFLFQKAV